MKGLYLYCVKAKADFSFSIQGIDGGKVWRLPYKDMEAVVSEVDLEEFGSNEIQKKAQEDLKWIKQKAQVHEQIIEAAMKRGDRIVSVIPMKFGTIFKTEKKLQNTLENYYDQFKKTLENLDGKQEWGVKVYVNDKIFKNKVQKDSLIIKEKEREMASMPEGMAYFVQKQIDDIVAKEMDNALHNYNENFFKILKQYTESSTKGKILEKEITGESLPMALNMIFLVSEKKLKDFVKKINKLGQEFENKGFVFEYSGPWPPYHFVA